MITEKEILEFAVEMEKVMNKHEKEKGDSWKTCSVKFLEEKLKEEYNEWEESLLATYNLAPDELVDIANVCMMLWHRLKKEKVRE